MASVSAGPRNVIEPSTAGLGLVPQAMRSVEYGSAPPGSVYARRRTTSTETRVPCVNVAPASAARVDKLEPPHLAEPERLGDRERPVPEVGLRSEEFDCDAVPGQRAQGERRLQRRDAASGDQDVCSVTLLHLAQPSWTMRTSQWALC